MMKTSPIKDVLLVLNSKDTFENEVLLRKAAAKKRYLSKTLWHIVILLPELSSFNYRESEEDYQAHLKKAQKLEASASTLLNLDAFQIYKIHNRANKVIDFYKKYYPGFILLIHRSNLDRMQVFKRIVWRKIKMSFKYLFGTKLNFNEINCTKTPLS